MSKDNKAISMLKSLKQKKHRDLTGLFLIEGEKFIDEIPCGFVKEYYVSQSYMAKYPEFSLKSQAPVVVLTDRVFESVSTNKTPQGRIALCYKPEYSLDALLDDSGNGLFILAEELNDPGNLGTIIRTAYAAGAAGVLLSNGTVELYNPKTLQSAAGAVFHVPVIENIDLMTVLPQFQAKGINVTAACADAAISVFDTDFTKPSALLVGNEARGLSKNIVSMADCAVKIPMPGGAESLNASVACAILIYEAIRQRSVKMQNPMVTFETTAGIIKAELYPEIAPNTVNNFISLVNKGFYNGLMFHRVINGFMIQGGCPRGDGTGGPGHHIPGEFSLNGFDNPLKHTEGVLSMARAQDPDSAGSQFFIMHKVSPHLNGSYAAFGKVTEGMETVDKIAECETDYFDKPSDDIVMINVSVETYGESYPEPETV